MSESINMQAWRKTAEVVSIYPFNVIEEMKSATYGEFEMNPVSPELFIKSMDKHLTMRERRAIELHYRDKKTFDEIGEMIGCSKQRTYKICETAFRKLSKYVDEMRTVPLSDFKALQRENISLQKELEKKVAAARVEKAKKHEDVKLRDLDLSYRLVRILNENNIYTLSECENYTERQLRSFKGFGETCLDELRTEMYNHGYKFLNVS